MYVPSSLVPEIRELNNRARFDPSTYPGQVLEWSVVITSSKSFPVEVKKSRRLGQSIVSIELGDGENNFPSLNKFLLLNNAAQIDMRVPVVAFGMNSDPEVMAAKFEAYCQKTGTEINRVFPMFRATLTGVKLGHLPRPSRDGFFAAAPYVAGEGRETRLEVTVAFLDPLQLAAVDETEPNYDRVLVTNPGIQLRIHSRFERELDSADPSDEVDDSHHELLQEFYLYVSKNGLLTYDGKVPTAFTDSQSELFGALAKLNRGFGPLKNKLIGQTPSDDYEGRVLHRQAREAAERLVLDCGLFLHNEGYDRSFGPDLLNPETQPKKYREIKSTWGDVDDENSLIVKWTAPGNNAFRTAPYVQLSDDEIVGRGLSDARVLKVTRTTGDGNWALPSMLVELRRLEKQESAGTQPASLFMDQIARNALGVENGERVLIEAAHAPEILKHRHVSARWQAADISVVEQDACILDVTAMKLLGVEDGDKVVLTGLPDHDGGKAPSLALRVFSAEDKIDLRRELDGGGLESRFPSTDDVLGVYPDVPWVFIDFDAAEKLRVGSPKLSPVLVRAGRLSILSREARELVLVLALAFLGAFGFFADAAKPENSESAEIYVLYGTLTVLVVFAAGMSVLWWRLQSRLGMPFAPAWLRRLVRTMFKSRKAK